MSCGVVCWVLKNCGTAVAEPFSSNNKSNEVNDGTANKDL